MLTKDGTQLSPFLVLQLHEPGGSSLVQRARHLHLLVGSGINAK